MDLDVPDTVEAGLLGGDAEIDHVLEDMPSPRSRIPISGALVMSDAARRAAPETDCPVRPRSGLVEIAD